MTMVWLFLSAQYIFGPNVHVDGYFSASLNVVDRKDAKDYGIASIGFGGVYGRVYLMEFTLGFIFPSINFVQKGTGISIPIGSLQLSSRHEIKLLPMYPVHPILSIAGGVGFAYFTKNQDLFNDVYFFLHPEVGMELNFSKGVRFVLSLGYRNYYDFLPEGLVEQDVDGITYSLILRLGDYR